MQSVTSEGMEPDVIQRIAEVMRIMMIMMMHKLGQIKTGKMSTTARRTQNNVVRRSQYDYIQSGLKNKTGKKVKMNGTKALFLRHGVQEPYQQISSKDVVKMILEQLGLDGMHEIDDNSTIASSVFDSPRSTYSDTTHSSFNYEQNNSSSNAFPLTEKYLSEARNQYVSQKSRTPWATEDDDDNETVGDDNSTVFTTIRGSGTFSVSTYQGGRGRVGGTSVVSYTDSMYGDRADYLLLDARTEEEFDECHITGATHYPLSMLKQVNWITPEIYHYKNKEAKKIIFYSLKEKEAAQAALSFQEHGIDNVFVMKGGLRSFVARAPSALVHGTPPELSEHEKEVQKSKKKNSRRQQQLKELKEQKEKELKRLRGEKKSTQKKTQTQKKKQRELSVQTPSSLLTMSPRKYATEYVSRFEDGEEDDDAHDFGYGQETSRSYGSYGSEASSSPKSVKSSVSGRSRAKGYNSQFMTTSRSDYSTSSSLAGRKKPVKGRALRAAGAKKSMITSSPRSRHANDVSITSQDKAFHHNTWK
eukprot:TRINITY_DN3817_c0_g1_i6.p1 TRINITY_DN3817_c0_g1~~TRINITY_DN3817_c0_g1_i6.p1  ORF type:complete len:530 (+),score=162.54 TRINITY_DN3817_c0_g1_i6:1556-3145(+)